MARSSSNMIVFLKIATANQIAVKVRATGLKNEVESIVKHKVKRNA